MLNEMLCRRNVDPLHLHLYLYGNLLGFPFRLFSFPLTPPPPHVTLVCFPAPLLPDIRLAQPPVSMTLIPSILYLCARWLRAPLVPLDMVRWIGDGSLPYMDAFRVRVVSGATESLLARRPLYSRGFDFPGS